MPSNHKGTGGADIVNNARAEYEDLKSELRRLTRKVEQVATESSETIIQKAEDMFDNVKEELVDRVDSVIEGTKDTTKKINDYVEDNPWQVAAFVLGVGFVLGMAVSQRRSPGRED